MSNRCKRCGVDLAMVGRAHRCVSEQVPGRSGSRFESGETQVRRVVRSNPTKSSTRAGAKRLGSRGPSPGSGGRPKKGDEEKTLKATKPWEAQGISQRTWYRRKAEREETKQ